MWCSVVISVVCWLDFVVCCGVLLLVVCWVVGVCVVCGVCVGVVWC